MDNTAELAREFERESNRIDQLVWDAMALRAGESALFCGCSNNVEWIKRAVEIGVNVSVVANDSVALGALQRVPVTVVRGSTSMLPGRDSSFDAAIAFHYLHEVDPFFHANIVSELGRVGKRLVVVEPEPPRDPLGSRISALYSRAKRELGQFENYNHLDYWRKLLSIVKSDVRCETFTFMRTPPRFAMKETVALIIDMMAAEDAPESAIAELRTLARRPDTVLVPQARFVVVGSAAGQVINVSAGAPFRERTVADRARTIASPFINAPARPNQPAAAGTEAVASTPGARPAPRQYTRPDIQPELPPLEPKAPGWTAPVTTAASKVLRNAFGLPPRDEPARSGVAPSLRGEEDVAFGPPGEATEAAAEFGWEWETPSKTL
jgi:hypothetical protein